MSGRTRWLGIVSAGWVWVGLLVPLTAHAAMDCRLLMPITDGAFWEVQVDGVTGITLEVLPGSSKVNGIPTRVILMTGGPVSGAREYLTNDETGARLHRVSYSDLYIPGMGSIDTSLTLDPALQMLFSEVEIGDEITSSGDAALYYEGYGTFSLDYSAVANVVNLEQVTVPYGTFEALRVEWELTMSGWIGWQFVSESESATVWLLAGVGELKSITSSSGETITSELVSTTLVPVPEPGARLASIAALLAISSCVRKRPRRAEGVRGGGG